MKNQFPENLAYLFKQCYKLLSNQLELLTLKFKDHFSRISLKSKSLERLLKNNISKNSFVTLNSICFSEAVGEQRIFFFPPDLAETFFTSSWEGL